MIVLGVDSGSLCTGYGLVEAQGGSLKSVAYGAIRNTSETPHPERLYKIQEALREQIRAHRPDLLALEDVFVAKNAKSALILGQVRGVVMALAVTEGVPVQEFTPNQVKMALTGYGHAEKNQMQQMIKLLLHLPTLPQPHDAADALAIAICASNRGGWGGKVVASFGGKR